MVVFNFLINILVYRAQTIITLFYIVTKNSFIIMNYHTYFIGFLTRKKDQERDK